MNYNDNIEADEALVLNTEEDQPYDGQVLTQKTCKASTSHKFHHANLKSSKLLIIRGKQNQTKNLNYVNAKTMGTNHSFNGFFNQNIKKSNKTVVNESIQQQNEPYSIVSRQKYQITNLDNFNSSGKLSNLQFVNDSKDLQNEQQNIHPEIKKFMKKYFPVNYINGHYYGQYVTLEDFVEIVLYQNEQIIGNMGSLNFIEEFAQKMFQIFGDKVYFDELFDKTLEKGLTGIVFEVVKSIHKDRRQQSVAVVQTVQKENSQGKDYTLEKSGLNPKLSQLRMPQSVKNNPNKHLIFQSKAIQKQNISKISLNKYFGSNLSKASFCEDSTNVSEEHLEEIKQILENYIESMYEEAESKLNKKYAQQMKKITLKYKQTQKLLEKVNEKISNHYDSIQLQKSYQKKIKQMSERQAENQRKINNLEYELNLSKDYTEKEKAASFKLSQQFEKLKEKLEKYENAIFQKAMEKNIQSNSSLQGDISRNTSSQPSQYRSNNFPRSFQTSQPKFQLKIDTVTEHRPIGNPKFITSPINKNQPLTYTSYFTGQTSSPIQFRNQPSISPIKQRVSFVKTQNPSTSNLKASNSNIVSSNENSGSLSNNPLSYSNVNGTPTAANRLKVSTVEKIQIGDPIQLRPLSPIGKLEQNNRNGIYTKEIGRDYSPIKVKFCSSRITTVNPILK